MDYNHATTLLIGKVKQAFTLYNENDMDK
jgi:hypothetical protein